MCTFIISGLFYLPIWFDNSFGLSWITAARPTEQGIIGLFARFTYKTWIAFGILQSFILIFGFYRILKSQKNRKIKITFNINYFKFIIIFIYTS